MAATPSAMRKWRRDNYYNDTDYVNYQLQQDIEDDSWNAEAASGVACFKSDLLCPGFKKYRFKDTKLQLFKGDKRK